jgi:hypothetical protein
MTLNEFAPIMAVLAAGCGRDPGKEQVKVYFDLLKDLDVEVLKQAAARAAMENKYPSLPPIGVIRSLAQEFTQGPRMTAIEAWGLVDRAIRRFDYDRAEEAFASLPPTIARVARAMGWYSLCFPGAGKTAVARAQFVAAYDSVCTQDEKFLALPVDMQKRLGVDKLFLMPDNRQKETRQLEHVK